MKRMVRKWIAGLVLAIGLGQSAFGAEIQCIADNGGGEYCGTGYGINVQVSTPSSGATIQYSESASGPWQDSLSGLHYGMDVRQGILTWAVRHVAVR